MWKILVLLIATMLVMEANSLPNPRNRNHEWNMTADSSFRLHRHSSSATRPTNPVKKYVENDGKTSVGNQVFQRSRRVRSITNWEGSYVWINDGRAPAGDKFNDSLLMDTTPSHREICRNVSRYVDVFTRFTSMQNISHREIKGPILFNYPCPTSEDAVFRNEFIPLSFSLEYQEKTYVKQSFLTESRQTMQFSEDYMPGFLSWIRDYIPYTKKGSADIATYVSKVSVFTKEIFTITFSDIASVFPSEEPSRAYRALPDKFEGHEMEYLGYIKRYGTSYKSHIVYGGILIMEQLANVSKYYKVEQNADGTYNHDLQESKGFEDNTIDFIKWEKETYENPKPIFQSSKILCRLMDPQIKNPIKTLSFHDAVLMFSKINDLRTQLDTYDQHYSRNELARFVSQKWRQELDIGALSFASLKRISSQINSRNYTKYWLKCYTVGANDNGEGEIKMFYITEGVCRNFRPTKCTRIIAQLPTTAATVDIHWSSNCDFKNIVYGDLNPNKPQTHLRYAFEHGKSFQLHVKGDF